MKLSVHGAGPNLSGRPVSSGFSVEFSVRREGATERDPDQKSVKVVRTATWDISDRAYVTQSVVE